MILIVNISAIAKSRTRRNTIKVSEELVFRFGLRFSCCLDGALTQRTCFFWLYFALFILSSPPHRQIYTQEVVKLRFPDSRECDWWFHALGRLVHKAEAAGETNFRSHPRVGVQFYIGAKDYFAAVLAALRSARRSVLVSAWSITPELQLDRSEYPPDPRARLDLVLQDRARAGVRINVLMCVGDRSIFRFSFFGTAVYLGIPTAFSWAVIFVSDLFWGSFKLSSPNDIQIPTNHVCNLKKKKSLSAQSRYDEPPVGLNLHSAAAKRHLESLHRNISVIAYRPHVASVYSHHMKAVVIDGVDAFIGGIDLAGGRYDDDRHLLSDPDARTWAGGDYSNPYPSTSTHASHKFVHGAGFFLFCFFFLSKKKLIFLTQPKKKSPPLFFRQAPRRDDPCRCGRGLDHGPVVSPRRAGPACVPAAPVARCPGARLGRGGLGRRQRVCADLEPQRRGPRDGVVVAGAKDHRCRRCRRCRGRGRPAPVAAPVAARKPARWVLERRRLQRRRRRRVRRVPAPAPGRALGPATAAGPRELCGTVVAEQRAPGQRLVRRQRR
jgi:hypothetical protein